MKFKKGETVIAKLHGAGYVTEEECVILKVDKQGVWLDNGKGNDPSGPFVNGRMEGVFGFWQEITHRHSRAAKASEASR